MKNNSWIVRGKIVLIQNRHVHAVSRLIEYEASKNEEDEAVRSSALKHMRYEVGQCSYPMTVRGTYDRDPDNDIVLYIYH